MAASIVSGLEIVQARGDGVEIRREVFQQTRLAIEADQRDAMRDVADQRFDRRAQIAIVVEMARARASDLHRNDQGQRLAVGILLERELLRDIVVGQQEVVGGQGVDRFPGLGPHQRRNEHQGGTGMENSAGLLRRSRSLCSSERAR